MLLVNLYPYYNFTPFFRQDYTKSRKNSQNGLYWGHRVLRNFITPTRLRIYVKVLFLVELLNPKREQKWLESGLKHH